MTTAAATATTAAPVGAFRDGSTFAGLLLMVIIVAATAAVNVDQGRRLTPRQGAVFVLFSLTHRGAAVIVIVVVVADGIGRCLRKGGDHGL